jgi:hypothetical protein
MAKYVYTFKDKIVLALGACFLLFFGIAAPLINHYHQAWVTSSPVVYVYDQSKGPANPAYVIEDLDYKEALISYYDTISANPDANPSLKFPIIFLTDNNIVYLVGYSEDSLLADVVTYNQATRRGPVYFRGWADVRTIHKSPPKFE